MDDTETICNLPLRNTIEFKRVITIMEFRHDILRTVKLFSFFTNLKKSISNLMFRSSSSLRTVVFFVVGSKIIKLTKKQGRCDR